MCQEKETQGKQACKCKQWVILDSTLLRKLPFPSCLTISCVCTGTARNKPREGCLPIKSAFAIQTLRQQAQAEVGRPMTR